MGLSLLLMSLVDLFIERPFPFNFPPLPLPGPGLLRGPRCRDRRALIGRPRCSQPVFTGATAWAATIVTVFLRYDETRQDMVRRIKKRTCEREIYGEEAGLAAAGAEPRSAVWGVGGRLRWWQKTRKTR